MILLPLLFFKNSQSKAQELSYEIVNTYPHDSKSFTQGLVWYKGQLYEGTGLYGDSRLIKVDLLTGAPLQEHALSKNDFGEGITILNNKIYQLTWKEHKIYVYDYVDLKKINEYPWPLEGWGMTHNGNHIIVSTGSDQLYFLDPNTMSIVKKITVNNNGRKITRLNELEYADGYIYANQYLTDDILKINPSSGNIEYILNLKNISNHSNCAPAKTDAENVLNGIAFNPTKNTFYITGKRWRCMFELKITNQKTE